MLIALLFLTGLGLIVAAVAMERRTARNAPKRRLDAIRARHRIGTGSAETQLRRIDLQRATRLDQTFQTLIPNPDLLRRRLQATGRNWGLGGYALVCGGLAVATWVMLALSGMPVLLTVLVGLLIGAGAPHLLVGRLIERRIARFLARFPDAIELLVRGLRSGLPISETLSLVGSEVPDPVGVEFRGIADRIRIGRTMEASLQETADRLPTPEFQFFVITLAIQRETGGNLAETLGNLADVLRKRLQMKLKVGAMSSESRASAYIIGALPFLVFLLIWYVSPGYMGAFFTDPRLTVALIGGLVWMAIGVLIMAKMIRFEV
ncbi:type II secretion system F family protein [Sphingomonas sp.]|uniref:type II secretion system F family protein n=1 Tax=Sphingomonas sp. TaxID=28214 RepID=UPI003B3A7AEE